MNQSEALTTSMLRNEPIKAITRPAIKINGNLLLVTLNSSAMFGKSVNGKLTIWIYSYMLNELSTIQMLNH